MSTLCPPNDAAAWHVRQPRTASTDDLDPAAQARMGIDPAWFASQINYLSFRYNSPTYELLEQRTGLLRPEVVVLYFLGQQDGLLARDISRFSGHPENTLSRAIQKLLEEGYIKRESDPSDKRNRVLYLRPRGRAVFEESLTVFVKRQETILATLSRRERDTLSRLLNKIVLDSANWDDRLPSTCPAKDGQITEPA